MNHDGEEAIFPGSRGATHLVEWIDGVLTHLQAGRVADAQAALQSEEWRALDLSGVPRPIASQMHETLQSAARALDETHPSPADAEAALLVARSRFLPGA